PAPRGRRDLRAEHACVPPGGARGGAPPAARVPDRAAARPERRPASQPGEDRHRRVIKESLVTVGADLREETHAFNEQLRQALADLPPAATMPADVTRRARYEG